MGSDIASRAVIACFLAQNLQATAALLAPGLAAGRPAAANAVMVTAYAASAASTAVSPRASHISSTAVNVDGRGDSALGGGKLSGARGRRHRGGLRAVLKSEKQRRSERQAKNCIFHLELPWIETRVALRCP